MAYFPFMMDIEDKICLVVGGGSIALHKAKLLLEFGARLKVVAPEVCKGFELLQKSETGMDGSATVNGRAGIKTGKTVETIEIMEKEFDSGDLEQVDFVVAATDDAALETYISELCRTKGIPVNVVDRKENCSFIFPAIIKQGDMVVSVSTGGKSPAGAGYVKRQIDKMLPEYYGDMISGLGKYRDYILENVPSPEKRKALFNGLLEYGDSHNGYISEDVVAELMRKIM